MQAIQNGLRSAIISLPRGGVAESGVPGWAQQTAREQIKALVVGGSPLLQAGVTAALSHDPQVRVVGRARDARDAVALLQQQPCDVMILNAESPQAEVSSLLRRLPSGSAVKILVLTDNGSSEELLGALRMGTHGYGIRESITPEELCAGILAVVQFQSWACSVATRQLMSNVSRLGVDQWSMNGRSGTVNGGRPFRDLTSREIAVLRLLAQGEGEQHIADTLCLSRNTVKTYLRRVCIKLSARSRAEAIRIGFQQGLVPDRRQVERQIAA